jgi:release factor glutamine methyltransferase
MTPGIDPPTGLESVAVALWGQHQGRRAAAELVSAGVRVLLLKGPDLQVRLYGTPARYPSGDVDVLVPRSQARLARSVLFENGWRFDPSNGALWRLSRAATFEREGFFLDLHWGLHAAHLPGVAFRRLERALWEGARDGVGEWVEPDDVSLAVYLGVHAAGHAFERPEWTENARAAAESVGGAAKVRAAARSVGVESAVRAALGKPKSGARVRILDGVWGGVISRLSWFLRGHFLPSAVRAAARDAVALRREGFGLMGRRASRVPFREFSLIVPEGVFAPTRSSAALVEAVRRAVAVPEGSPIVIDVGCGSGAVGLAVASELPNARVLGVDSSTRAIRAARANAARLCPGRASFAVGTLLEPVPHAFHGAVKAIVSNIPFVAPWTVAETKSGEAPRATVAGPGADGLGLVRELVRQSSGVLALEGILVLQLTEWQWRALEPALLAAGFRIRELIGQSHSPAVIGVAERS